MLELLGFFFLLILGLWIIKSLIKVAFFTAGGFIRVLAGLLLLALFFPVLLFVLPVAAAVGFVVLSVVFVVVTVFAYAILGLFV